MVGRVALRAPRAWLGILWLAATRAERRALPTMVHGVRGKVHRFTI